MATIKYLIQGKSLVNPIYLRLSLTRSKSLKRKTGLFINKNDWSLNTGFPKQNNVNNKNLTTDLKELSVFIIKSLNNSDTQLNELSGDWLNHQIDLFFDRVKSTETSELLIDAIQSIIDEANTRKNGRGSIGLSKSRVNAYKSLKNKIIEYQGKHKTLISEVNLSYAKDFLKHLINDKEYSENTALKLIADLKTVCYDAELNGLTISKQVKKITSAKTKNDNILYLNKEEIQLIKEVKLNTNSLENARKWLIIGVEIGQRGGDLLNLTESNFVTRNGYDVIELKQQKTDKLVTIPVLESTSEIIKTGLPYKIAIQKFNGYIKTICKEAGIDEVIKGSKAIVIKKEKGKTIKRKKEAMYPKYQLMTSHVCRRSFATNLYGELPTPLIMQITAHSSEKNLMNYIGKNSLDYAKQIADFYKNQPKKE